MKQIHLKSAIGTAFIGWVGAALVGYLSSKISSDILKESGYFIATLCSILTVFPTLDVVGEIFRRLRVWLGSHMGRVSLVIVMTAIMGGLAAIAFIVLIQTGIAHSMR